MININLTGIKALVWIWMLLANKIYITFIWIPLLIIIEKIIMKIKLYLHLKIQILIIVIIIIIKIII